MCHICDMAHSYGDASLLDVCLARIHDEQVLMYIYISIYISLYIHIYMYVCIYMCISYVTWLIHMRMPLCSTFVLLVSTMNRCSFTFISLYISLSIYIYICIYIFVYICICVTYGDVAHSYGDASLLDFCLARIHDEQVLMYIYISVYIYIYMCVYIYMCHIYDMAHSYADASLVDAGLARIHDERVLMTIYISLCIIYMYTCIYMSHM